MMADGPANAGKVFVGGLAPHSTDDSLKNYFSGFGAVQSAEVMMANDMHTGGKRSRCFGFVVFQSPAIAEEIVNSGEAILLDGKQVDVKRIDENRMSAEGKAELESRKIFVGGLPENCDVAMLKAYFQKIDPNLIEARVKTDPRSDNRSRGFGYVTFSEPEFVQRALSEREVHHIDGKWIDVKPCVPQSGGKKGFGKGKGKGKGKTHSYGHHQTPSYGYQQQTYQYPAVYAADPYAGHQQYAYATIPGYTAGYATADAYGQPVYAQQPVAYGTAGYGAGVYAAYGAQPATAGYQAAPTAASPYGVAARAAPY